LFSPIRNRFSSLRARFRGTLTRNLLSLTPTIEFVKKGYQRQSAVSLMCFNGGGKSRMFGGGKWGFLYGFSKRGSKSYLRRALNIWQIESGSFSLATNQMVYTSFFHHYSHFVKSYRYHRRNRLFVGSIKLANSKLYGEIQKIVARQTAPFLLKTFPWYEDAWGRTIAPYLRNISKVVKTKIKNGSSKD
jgi:hypothetical protein